MARRKIIHHVTFYRVIHDLAHLDEFGFQAVLDAWYNYSRFTVPTKMQLASILPFQPMIEVVTPHGKAQRLGDNKRPQTYRICPIWIENNPLEEIMKKSSRGKVVLN